MPTECERNSSSLAAQKQQQHQQQQQLEQQHQDLASYQQTFGMNNEISEQLIETITTTNMAMRSQSSDMLSKSQKSVDSPTTPTTDNVTTNGLKGSTNGGESKKTSLISPDPTSYVTKARVTRPIPPPPSYNPMQFVQIKPCNLYQTAQEQLKKAEEVKKIKEIKKEEPEEWQNNLDNWKSSRRKRVEHIIDRVVEVKKLELEEHDRTRRKSKTFSEMIEERGERAGGRPRTKLTSLTVYNEDETNDLSDLGIGTSSASGKSSLSDDYDNNSVTSDNAELDKAIQNENNHKSNVQQVREYISSPGYETSSSTAPASSPDPCEYTYEGAIQDYKQRISRAAASITTTVAGGSYKLGNNSNNNNNNNNNNNSNNMIGNGEQQQQHEQQEQSRSSNFNTPKPAPPTTLNLNSIGKSTSSETKQTNSEQQYSSRRGHKIEDRLLSFEITSPSAQENQDGLEKNKVDLPKIDISKRKEIFENQNASSNGTTNTTNTTGGTTNGNVTENNVPPPRVTLRDRFKTEKSIEEESNQKKEIKRLSGDVTSIRQRMMSLEQKEPTANITTRSSVDIPVPPLKDRLSSLQNAVKKEEIKKPPVALVDARQLEIMKKEEEEAKQRMQEQDVVKGNSELNDSGILTAEETTESASLEQQQQRQQQDQQIQEQESQLNAAIAALALEEQQLEQAANAVNQIEAEFDELSNAATAQVASNSTNQTQLPYEMDFSVSATNNLPNKLHNSSSSSSSSYGDGRHGGCVELNAIGGGVETPRSSLDSNFSNCSSISQVTVIAVNTTPNPTSTASKLIRKPSNEMVHHRNLLKMFKETFKNDIELDEGIEDAASPTPKSPTLEILNFPSNSISKSPTFETSKSPLTTPYLKAAENTLPLTPKIDSPSKPSNPTTPQSPNPSMIPRAITSIANKPPSSPKTTIRGLPNQSNDSPLSSPMLQRKPASAFSINGRVEIFNSKTMLESNDKGKSMQTPKKPYLSHLPNQTSMNVATACQSNAAANTSNIELPTRIEKHKNTEEPQTELISKPPVITTTPAASIQALPISKQTSKIIERQAALQQQQQQQTKQQHHQQQPQSQHQETEIVMCAPPVTIVNPDELPKPNTVKALSSCFSQEANSCNASGNRIPSMPPPKPLPRTRIPQLTPPQSPIAAKRNHATTNTDITDWVRRAAATPSSLEPTLEEDKKLSMISNVSTISSESSLPSGHFTTNAIVHSPPQGISRPSSSASSHIDSMIIQPSISPNSQFKPLPQTPKSPNLSSPNSSTRPPLSPNLTSPNLNGRPPLASKSHLKPLPLPPSSSNNEDPLKPNDSLTPVIDSPSAMPALVICTPNESSLFKLASSSPPSPASPTKLKETTKTPEPTEEDVAICSSFLSRLVPKSPQCFRKAEPEPPIRQETVEEVLCDKVDVRKLSPHDQIPWTSYQEINTDEIKRCDNLNETKPKTPTSKPTSPILAARAAHSKALIDTCEKIIAEERAASNQIKSTLASSSSPKSTPIMARKSKIPKPIQCCIGSPTDTLPFKKSPKDDDNKPPSPPLSADTPNATNEADENMLVGRLHVVETQIKVTTTTPPTSPKPEKSDKSHHGKGVKNTIFDFIKKNFGLHEAEVATVAQADEPKSNTEEDIVKIDEIRKIENSKFYLPTDEPSPPPLPKTPAPVNIEITRRVTTDEIKEESNPDSLEFSQELSDLLDDELNKLSLDSKTQSVAK